MRYDKLLPTMGIGSYATPGWLFPFREAMTAGRTGPADEAEAFDDATRIVIADQIEAGIDVISDGELRRQRFVYEMYDRIGGLKRIPTTRRLGVPGYDRAPKFVADEKVAAPDSLGLREEYESLARLAPGRHLKIAFPGPLTFLQNIDPGEHYGPDDAGRQQMAGDIVDMLRQEVASVVDAGADFVQIDEPGLTSLPHDLDLEAAADLVNAVVAGHEGKTAVHICYGNNASRPYAKRDMARLMPAVRALRSPVLLLEFANREMAEVELLAELSGRFAIAAGVIDVKSFHQETPEDVAERIRTLLRHVPPDQLIVTADCGFSAIPRWLARQKLQSMAAGAALVREKL